MADTPGIQYPLLDERGAALAKAAGVECTTYGRFGCKGFAFDAPAPVAPATSQLTTFSFKYPFRADLVEGALYLTGAEVNDTVRFVAAPNTSLNALVGGGNVLAAPIAVGDKKIKLVAPYLASFVGFALIDAGLWEIVVSEGPTTEATYLVTGYNKTTGDVDLGIVQSWTGGVPPAAWAGFVNAFTVAATVRVTRVFVDAVELDSSAQVIRFGQSARSAGPVPAGTELRFEYTNKGAVPRRVRFVPDFLSGVPLSAGG